MRTICVLSRKGGTGKTTVSTSLAIAGHLRGQKTLLADVDPQHSSHASLGMRTAPGPGVEATCGGKLFAMKTMAELRDVQTFIIDTPAGLEACVFQSVQIADFCLVVTRPNYLDLASALTTTNVLRQLNKPALILINQAPATREGLEASATVKAREALRFVRYPVADAVLCSRFAYARATGAGMSVEETEPSSLAAQEVRTLWDEVAAAADLQRRGVVTGGSRSAIG
jgi:chromosome partitioning protein